MDKKIYTTSDYSKFKKLLGNRDTKCVNKFSTRQIFRGEIQ